MISSSVGSDSETDICNLTVRAVYIDGHAVAAVISKGDSVVRRDEGRSSHYKHNHRNGQWACRQGECNVKELTAS